MIPDIYYVNSQNEKIDFLEPPYMLQTGNLFDSSWEYEYSETSYGGVITTIKKALEERSLTISVLETNEITFEEAMEHLHEVLDIDAILQKPGRLYVGDMHTQAYITASEKSEWENDAGYTDIDLTVVIENPIWIREEKYSFYSEGIKSLNNKRYPGRYPYRYVNGVSGDYIINPYFKDANFKLVIYGPVIKPQVTIGDNTYRVNITLEEKERLEIDTRERTIVKIKAYGERISAYHNRQKGMLFFRKIPTGRHYISWTGKFDFDIILYEERSEPRWKM